jgi:FkbH-like protein
LALELTSGVSESSEPRGIMDYVRLARKIDSDAQFEKAPANRRIKIAVLSGFTLGGFREALLVRCVDEGISPKIYIGGYNQYNQEILDPASALYAFHPDLVILMLDTRTIAGEHYLQPYAMTDDQRREWVRKTFEMITSLVDKVQKGTSARVIVNNFEVPTHSPLGIIENRTPFGFRDSVLALNSELREEFRGKPSVFLFDYESFASKVGKENLLDYTMYYLGDIRVSPQLVPRLCDGYVPYVRAMLSMTKKCLVLDLDNILWGGIIGEDGLGGIKLGPTPEGSPFFEFQKYVLSLYQRGVILAINSANNPEDALEVFRKHQYMVLKEEHFASIKINWDDKISNMKAIAEEIEIGVDSLVFVDDSNVNRELIRQALPEVTVVDIPQDPALYLKTLEELRVFDSLQLTEEDKKRGQMYAEQRKRVEFQGVAGDITEYLKALGQVVTIENLNQLNLPRISQLSQKTNQFNTTTRRYLEGDVRKMADSGNFLVVGIRVQDKFGDSGLTGVAIVEKGGDKWRIDCLLLSCRVIGRKVEDALLAYIMDQARKGGAKTLVGEFIPTKKNAPTKDFYRTRGFTQTSVKDGVEIWEYGLKEPVAYPQYLQVVVK